MKKLKIILLFSFSILFVIRLYTFYNYKSIYDDGYAKLEGIVINIKYNDKNMTITLNLKEDIIVKYKGKIDIKIGDVISIEGNISKPNSNTVFNLFNYKNYLLSKKIYRVLNADNILIIKKNTILLYKLKNFMINRLDDINNNYLYTLILADNRIDDKIYDSIKTNGISHLFAISGMHISLLSLMILKLLNIFIKNNHISYLINICILIIYMLIIGTPSIIRSVLLFIIITFNKFFKTKVKTIYLLIMVLYIMLLYNPYYIYDIGFLYSFIISFALIKFNYLYSNKNYILKILIISIISTLVSLPITINNNFSINIISPIINIIYVPFMSFIFFPLSLMVFIIPNFLFIYNFFIIILEYTSILFNKYSIILYFGYINIYIIIIYYIMIYSIFNNIKMYKLFLLLLILLFQYNIHYFNFDNKLTMIDVKQGDSFLLELKNRVILIDTGGIYNYDLANNTIIPYLNSLGIRKIDFLILSHGDYDHIGSSINLINNFKIDNIIMNSGNDNKLEKNIISLSKKKNIKLRKISKQKINIYGNFFYFLNKINIEENKDSLMIYLRLNNYGILFTGDSTKEEEIIMLDNYNLKVDVLKIGHHGSKSSTSNRLIKELMPKYALISVGLYNKYNHPNKEVINILENNNINTYMTSINGSVKMIFRDKITVYTCKTANALAFNID